MDPECDHITAIVKWFNITVAVFDSACIRGAWCTLATVTSKQLLLPVHKHAWEAERSRPGSRDTFQEVFPSHFNLIPCNYLEMWYTKLPPTPKKDIITMHATGRMTVCQYQC